MASRNPMTSTRLAALQFSRSCTSHARITPHQHPKHISRPKAFSTGIITMASDDAYMAFLGKANQDTGAGSDDIISTTRRQQTTSSGGFAATKAVDTDVPPKLQQIDKYYMSETDEPFEPVSLSWSKSTLPSEDEFKTLIDHPSADVDKMDMKDFDPKGQYSDVVDTVVGVVAGNGGQRQCYRVHHGNTRVEYYLVALDVQHSRLVGVKAKAVES